MNVPNYQMYNVLKVYSRQLKQNMAGKRGLKVPQNLPVDRTQLAPEEKRQATIKKVSKNILDKIAHYGRLKVYHQRISGHARAPSNEATSLHKPDNRMFVFNEINTINQKSKNSLSVHDSSFFIKKFDQLARKAND